MLPRLLQTVKVLRKTNVLKFSSVRLPKRFSTLKLSHKFVTPEFAHSVAVIDEKKELHLTYGELNEAAAKLAEELAYKLKENDPDGTGTVGAFNKSSTSFVVAMLAAWKLGRVFVPLSVTHSESELSHIVVDSNVQVVCCSDFRDIDKGFRSAMPLLPTVEVNDILDPYKTNTQAKDPSYLGEATDYHQNQYLYHRGADIDSPDPQAGALVIYTSGTTGRPKGVLHTHRSLFSMTNSLVEAWEYTSSDKILHFLPLYHVHGLVNKLLCVLSAGGTVEFLPSAKPDLLWGRLAMESVFYDGHKHEERRDARRGGDFSDKAPASAGNPASFKLAYKPLTLFMGVPTIYGRMLEAGRAMRSSAKEQDEDKAFPKWENASRTMRRLRLQACGSAALPDSILVGWKDLTGCTLLERYGMTEIGMALSNPYLASQGERRRGYVGQPLPGVQCRLVDAEEDPENEAEVRRRGVPGELRIKGPNVFKEYLNRPDATAESFDAEGWFKTGDIAEVSDDGYYKILGRNSTDIIKVGC
jgi:malonyl-CoA/methylmalonyl-CoA synthetase